MALKTLKSKVKYRISRSKDTVFTPGDFLDLSGRDQVIRALRQLIDDEVLIRFGYGLYAKASRSPYTGNIIPDKALPSLAREALTNKLGAELGVSRALELYNSGRSTQVPTGRAIPVKKPVKRKMFINKQRVWLQHVS